MLLLQPGRAVLLPVRRICRGRAEKSAGTVRIAIRQLCIHTKHAHCTLFIEETSSNENFFLTDNLTFILAFSMLTYRFLDRLFILRLAVTMSRRMFSELPEEHRVSQGWC